MSKIQDLADFFISLGNVPEEDAMTNMRSNKLLYFSQGWFLQRFNRTLFDEPIEAWTYGPVIPSMYRKYHNYGKNVITECSAGFTSDRLSPDELQLLLDVYAKYRGCSTSRLVEMSHEPNTPWAKIYADNKGGIIPISLIHEWFVNHPPLKKFGDSFPPEVELIGRTDPATGLTVLPAEEDEGDEAYADLV